MELSQPYVHGRDDAEATRLHDQARTLEELLHHDSTFPGGGRVLEVGCGVGAQSPALLRRNPQIELVAVDTSAVSVTRARAHVRALGYENAHFERGDLYRLPHPDHCFDHVFICFVLEHLSAPADALRAVLRKLRPGGTLQVVEGDHGSVMIHPHSDAALRAVDNLCELQRRAGGDPQIGRRLAPLLVEAGLLAVQSSPRFVLADAAHPELRGGFIDRTFTAMVAGVRDQAIAAGLNDAQGFSDGLAGLRRTAEPDGVFCYTFFKAIARKS
jgi:SAM-dependent methyltransferase